jgi:hypothetical protein
VPRAGPFTPQAAAIASNDNLVGVPAYARPRGLVVAGRSNHSDQAFRQVFAAGGTVLVYLDTIIDNRDGRYHDLLLNGSELGPAVPGGPGMPQANQWGASTTSGWAASSRPSCPLVLERMAQEHLPADR